MTSLSLKKGLRTRYENLLAKEMKDIRLLFDLPEENHEEHIRKIDLASMRLTNFSEKYESSHQSLAEAIEAGDKPEDIDAFLELEPRTIDMITMATESLIELEALRSNVLYKTDTPRDTDPVKFVKTTGGFSQIKLPKFELPGFSGNIQDYLHFIDFFMATVDKNPDLSKVEKFTYLRSKLSGDALRTIEGLALSNKNYNVALNIIDERFGNKEAIIASYYAELINLQTATNCPAALRKLLDTLNINFRSLKALGQDTSQGIFVSMIHSKLPKDIILQLELNKTEPWTVDKLIRQLSDIIRAHETAERVTTSSSTLCSKQLDGKTNSSSSVSYRKQLNGKALYKTAYNRNSYSSRRQKSRSAVCIYCQKNHWSDDCSEFRTLDDRKAKIKGKCFICLAGTHYLNSCPVDKPCFHCKTRRNHHRSVCPKMFPSRQEKALLAPEISAISVPEVSTDTNINNIWTLETKEITDAMLVDDVVAVDKGIRDPKWLKDSPKIRPDWKVPEVKCQLHESEYRTPNVLFETTLPAAEDPRDFGQILDDKRLPVDRVSESPPLQFKGIGDCRPLFEKCGGENQKVWVYLFTCLVVCAIYLEIVREMSAEQLLIICRRRFIARRQTPRKLTSYSAIQFQPGKSAVANSWNNIQNDSDVTETPRTRPPPVGKQLLMPGIKLLLWECREYPR